MKQPNWRKLQLKKKLVCSIFHNRRYDGDFRTLQKLVADQTLGDLVYLESHFDRFRPTVSENWREKDVPGNGITYDLGSHLIDQVVLLFGKPDSIFSDIQKQRKKTPLQTIILIFHSSIPPSKLG